MTSTPAPCSIASRLRIDESMEQRGDHSHPAISLYVDASHPTYAAGQAPPPFGSLYVVLHNLHCGGLFSLFVPKWTGRIQRPLHRRLPLYWPVGNGLGPALIATTTQLQ
eukprot:GGOE01053384.1.p3 GENE.GGOE01053384.1~~GGOE01053384.1.p3  ORF type:complete len:109 (+),score=1.47 GGOE01053384.1:613-939(+)